MLPIGVVLRRASALTVATTLLGALALTPTAHAQPSRWDEVLAGDDGEVTRRLWQSATALIDCVADRATCAEAPPADEVVWAQVEARMSRILVRRPDDLSALAMRAVAASYALPERPSREDLLAAIEAYEACRDRAPELAPQRVAFELAILRTRMGDFRGASSEYARAASIVVLPRVPSSGAVAPWELVLDATFGAIPARAFHANWAEVEMLGGDADRATELYQLALLAELPGSRGAALTLWGLALARSRSGAHEAAVATACAAIDVGLPDESVMVAASRAETRARWGPFAALHDEDVFFEPAYEIHAYEALGHECLAGRSTTVEGRSLQLGRARASWRSFLLGGGQDGPWAEPARVAAARLEALAREGP